MAMGIDLYAQIAQGQLDELNKQETVTNKELGWRLGLIIAQGFLLLAYVLVQLMTVAPMPQEELH